MIQLNDIKAMLQAYKNSNDSINYVDLVIDDSELVSILKERKDAENTYIIAVCPSFGFKGTENALKYENRLMFFVLNKTSRRDLSREERLEVIQSTQLSAKSFIEHLVRLHGECGAFQEMDFSSLNCDVVWEKAQCSGWYIEIDFMTI